MQAEYTTRAVELHYTGAEVALLLRKSRRYVHDKIRAGAFGTTVFFVDGVYLVPASGVNAFLAAHPVTSPGVKARTEGELRRKIAGRRREVAP